MPTTINIKIERKGKQKYTADCKNLPGMPPVGHGRSIKEAIGSLICGLATEAEEGWDTIIGVRFTLDIDKEAMQMFHKSYSKKGDK